MSGAFGPWARDIPQAERCARLRAMQALALVLARPHTEFVVALRRAESDPASLPQALELLERLPAVTRRRLLATYGVLAGPDRRRRVAPEVEHIERPPGHRDGLR